MELYFESLWKLPGHSIDQMIKDLEKQGLNPGYAVAVVVLLLQDPARKRDEKTALPTYWD